MVDTVAASLARRASVITEGMWRRAETDMIRREKYRLRRAGFIWSKDDVLPQVLVLNPSQTHAKDTGGRWEPQLGYGG